ncbi:DUF1572 domain-containing protein [Cytophagaceae bacterium DM2B3-1]|uniref:DUF1572 domain-containing protein n=1 Tax=Xanthocytophaga flava TaxID=3048013 RepID=A0ABT7CMX1_9BACT|nr:DUF1572 domain-containing protein [Xanthocytophaga flavus]MDJ1469819.1 DUF1572 domain-containing protein [Xanthocytophaga flavus]MDJ1494332.1 DUF1572 domain-containing protein [Xanthocytophaga flavus]
MQSEYLESIRKQFRYYKDLGDKAMSQVTEQNLFEQINPTSNSIAIIVNHLWGNMLSRWTDFLTTDGEKEWRNRDAEFENHIQNKDDLLQKWNEGWECLFNALTQLQEADLTRIIYIRNEGHTVQEAINRQLAHYPYHVGQIVYLAKLFSGDHWQSLSIPKGQSQTYNAAKFTQSQGRRHFTDDWLPPTAEK